MMFGPRENGQAAERQNGIESLAPPAAPHDSAPPPVPSPPTPPADDLSDFLRAHYTLIAVVAGLTSVIAFTTKFSLGWIDTYLRFLLVTAALLVWLELLRQWPAELQIHRGQIPRGHHWRMVGFAYALQLTGLGFVGYIFWTVPELFVPLVAVAVAGLGGLLGWRVLERRSGSRLLETDHARVLAIAGIASAFLLSELLLDILVTSHISVFDRIWQAVQALLP